MMRKIMIAAMLLTAYVTSAQTIDDPVIVLSSSILSTRTMPMV